MTGKKCQPTGEKRFCPYCDAEIAEAAFPYCEACEVTITYCPECQKPVPRGKTTCPACGAAVGGEAAKGD